jgi:hypothetical protein
MSGMALAVLLVLTCCVLIGCAWRADRKWRQVFERAALDLREARRSLDDAQRAIREARRP